MKTHQILQSENLPLRVWQPVYFDLVVCRRIVARQKVFGDQIL